MVSICPLLIRASFIGRTYHDFQLKFQSPSTNCTNEYRDNPLLIQFTRILNSTLNDTSYILYNPTESTNQFPHLQVFHNDHVNLCIRSALHTNNNDMICHEFYMITMLSSINASLWPLLIIFSYITILLFAMLFSLFAQKFNKFSKTLFSRSITKKLVRKHNIRSFIPLIQRHEHNHHFRKIDEKKEFLKLVDIIAKDYRSKNKYIYYSDTK
ncbi:unnamed protein product [Adineta steineri]|uniref:Uncharacterized protein n=1 Tax=Adineta steineri TaxID=433720 RepID=A0A814JKY2_9BILA|nr:unnamed protein product [Adineta steineri]CAF3523057.1 unnamed protein product [Adineta steineri]